MTATRWQRLGAATALVVVFVVGACTSGNHATAVACDKDVATLRTAEESYFARNNTYGTYDQLVAAHFLDNPGSGALHTINLSVDGASYSVVGTTNGDCRSNYPSVN
jgi:hypothetical protein